MTDTSDRLITIGVKGPPTVTVRQETDTNPDLSWLGEYSSDSSHQHEPITIDRQERGDNLQGQHRYFHGGSNYGDDPEAERYVAEDYLRMENYNRGFWGMVGVIATAVLETEAGSITQEASIWGVESDSGDEYFKQLEDEQKGEALRMLGESVLAQLEGEQ